MQARVHARDQPLNLQPCVGAWHELTTPCANIHGPRTPLRKCACARRFTHVPARVNSYIARNLVDFFFPIFLLLFFSFALIFFDPFLLIYLLSHIVLSLLSCLQAFSFLRCGIFLDSFFILPLSFCHSFLFLLPLFLSKRPPLLHVVLSLCHLPFYDTDLVFFNF